MSKAIREPREILQGFLRVLAGASQIAIDRKVDSGCIDFTETIDQALAELEEYYVSKGLEPLSHFEENFKLCPQCGTNLPTLTCPKCFLRFKTPTGQELEEYRVSRVPSEKIIETIDWWIEHIENLHMHSTNDLNWPELMKIHKTQLSSSLYHLILNQKG